MRRAAAELREIASDYLSHTDLLWQLVLRDLRVRYKQAVMGFLWALFLPLLLVGSGMVLRLVIAGASGSSVTPSVIGGVAIRSVLWAGFAGAVSFGAVSLTGNSSLVGKVYFPREVLPLSAVISAGVDTLVALSVVVVILPLLGGRLSLALLWLPALFLILMTGTFALVLALSAANLFFRDVKYLVQAVLSVGVLLTPVFYSTAELGPRAAALIAWNPLTPLLEGVTHVIFGGHGLAQPILVDGAARWSPGSLGTVAVLAALSLVGASLLFHRAEDLFAERL